MSEFTLRDSGHRREFGTGSLRDTDTGKPRPDFISPYAMVRFGNHMAKGAEKYGPHNWELGQPVSQFVASLYRHLLAFMRGERDEDHMAAVMYGAQAILHFEERAKLGDPVALKMLDAFASKALAEELEWDAVNTEDMAAMVEQINTQVTPWGEPYPKTMAEPFPSDS